MVPASKEFPFLVGRLVGREGEFQGLLDDSTGRTESYVDRLCPNLRHVSTVEHGAGYCNVTFGKQTRGEDCFWLQGDRIRGQE